MGTALSVVDTRLDGAFSVDLCQNAREYTKYSLRFLLWSAKNSLAKSRIPDRKNGSCAFSSLAHILTDYFPSGPLQYIKYCLWFYLRPAKNPLVNPNTSDQSNGSFASSIFCANLDGVFSVDLAKNLRADPNTPARTDGCFCSLTMKRFMLEYLWRTLLKSSRQFIHFRPKQRLLCLISFRGSHFRRPLPKIFAPIQTPPPAPTAAFLSYP